MRRAYFGSKLSTNMLRTPEDYLVCKNVPIARIGAQDYRGCEFGGEDNDRMYRVERPEDEVFSKAAIASFEGKPVVDEHPDEDVKSDNYIRYMKGVCRDVRRGDGDLANCLIADLVIYDRGLIDKIRGGKRDISCGYDCLWIPTQDGYTQREIRGNHIAVVDKGRAGRQVSIRDRAEKGEGNMARKGTLWGRMLAAFAKDSETTPEELERAAQLRPTDDEEDVVPRKEEEREHTWDVQELGDRLRRIEDTLEELAGRRQEISAEDDDDEDETDELDKLQDELRKEADDEEDVEVPPEEINRQHEEDADREALRDAAMEAVHALRPVVAQLPPKQRKRAADSLARLIRGQVKDSGYQALMAARRSSRTVDSAEDERALGRRIRDAHNPHYQHK